MQRIGLLGGTFDPVHDGHLQLAQLAREELALDKVLLVPAADPPHKGQGRVSAFQHRQAMLRLALADQIGLELCLVEEELPQPSYTISTIRHLQRVSPPGSIYSFIVGVDAFADLLTWREYHALLRAVGLVVAVRRGFTGWQRLEGLAEALGYRRDGNVWRSSSGLSDIVFLSGMPEELSSSEIRQAIAAGERTIVGLHQEVRRYICQHHLYQHE